MMKETELGFEYADSRIIAFFGKREAQSISLQTAYPNILFKKIKQVHSDGIVSTSLHSIDFSSEADAHFSHAKNLGLCISTADCVPILIDAPGSGQVYAIHAGWKGVAQRIFPKALALLKKKEGFEELRILIGPHIQQESFEIGADVKTNLESSMKISHDSNSVFRTSSSGKYFANLSAILRLQAQEYGIRDSQIHEIKFDTLTDLRFHSYRRDKENSGRQISFIALK